MNAREYLGSTLATREQVDRFICREVKDDIVENNRGWTYDAELGWVPKAARRDNGINGSMTFYNYNERGARVSPGFLDQRGRMQTFGNSFTHCDQVNDGETWQEYLGAHIDEPLENYGVGGYSVYQAYLRMVRVQERSPAEYVILNIFSDDHFRNLDSLRGRIRSGRVTSCSFPLPHLRVDVTRGTCARRPNPCPTPEDLYKLTDLDYVTETFKDDPVLQLVAARGGRIEQSRLDVPVAFGVNLSRESAADGAGVHARAALFATRQVLGWTEEYVRAKGGKLMVILSHGAGQIRERLLGKPDWDQSFVDYLRGRPYPVVDLRDAHEEDFRQWNLDVDAYLARYFIGHYGPAGNFFCAQAIKSAIIEWLDPKPRPYRGPA